VDSHDVISIVAILATVIGSLGAAWISRDAQRKNEKINKLEKKVQNYRDEIIARIALERSAIRWIEINGQISFDSAQNILRTKASRICGIRPKMTPSDFDWNVPNFDNDFSV